MIVAPNFSSPESLLIVGPWIVGATFLWTGIIKSIAPHVFSAHLTQLGWIPPKLNASAVVAAAGIESAWGAALILGVAPAFLLPATAALLASQGVTSPRAIEAILKSTALDLGTSGRDDSFGHGLIQPRAALFGMGIRK